MLLGCLISLVMLPLPTLCYCLLDLNLWVEYGSSFWLVLHFVCLDSIMAICLIGVVSFWLGPLLSLSFGFDGGHLQICMAFWLIEGSAVNDALTFHLGGVLLILGAISN